MGSEHEKMMFFQKYHYHRPRTGLQLMIDEGFESAELTTYDPSTADVLIRIAGTTYSWEVHQDVIRNHSNFFRRALAGQFRESRSQDIELHEVDGEDMGFVVHYIYNGWYETIFKFYNTRYPSDMSITDIMRILKIADYLDMPALTYVAYEEIVCRLAKVAMLASVDPQFAHNLCIRKKPYIAAAEALDEWRAPMSLDLARSIRVFLSRLQGVNDLQDAVDAFKMTFRGHHSVIKKLEW